MGDVDFLLNKRREIIADILVISRLVIASLPIADIDAIGLVLLVPLKLFVPCY